MKKELATWQFIKDGLSNDLNVVLLYVLASSGSSPGRAGFFMAVNGKNEMQGSVGGGIMEHKFVEMAKARLAVNNELSSVYTQVHDKSSPKDQSGMICSGEQVIWIYGMHRNDLELVNRIIESYEKLSPLVLQITADGISILQSPCTDDEPGLSGFASKSTNEFQSFVATGNDNWRYLQKLGYTHQLHIIGGGHCSLALSEIMAKLNFYIHVYDERKGLNTMDTNGYAQKKIIIEDYTNIAEYIPTGKNVYVVIMTFGYRTDDAVLRALMQKHFDYIGCLGSKKKIEKMFAAYRKENIDEHWLNKIHAPIGMQIRSQTPEEIAVSIAAEIIRVRNFKGLLT